MDKNRIGLWVTKQNLCVMMGTNWPAVIYLSAKAMDNGIILYHNAEVNAITFVKKPFKSDAFNRISSANQYFSNCFSDGIMCFPSSST